MYYYLLSYTKSGESIEVPDLSGLDLMEAESTLSELELQFEVIDSLYLPDKRGGEIVDQEPMPASLVKTGRKIYVTIARYSTPMTKLPNVLDQTLPLAMAKLASYGFKVGNLIYKSSDCKDCVVDVLVGGKSVKAGARLAKGKRVDIVVGQGLTNEMISVPVLYGLKLGEAIKLLHLNNLNIGATPYDPEILTKTDSLNAVVYRQSPAPEGAKMAPAGSPIEVYLTSDVSKVPTVNIDSLKSLIK